MDTILHGRIPHILSPVFGQVLDGHLLNRDSDWLGRPGAGEKTMVLTLDYLWWAK